MTSKRFRRAFGVFMTLIVLHSALLSQDDEQNRERYGEQGRSGERAALDVVSFEPHFFGVDTGSVRVDILYRIRYDFFVFTRDPATVPTSFRAHGDLMIELADSTDISVSRKVESILLKTSDNEVMRLRGQYFQGAASFVVHPGRYTAVYRINDLESKREFADRREVIRVPRYRMNALVRSSLVFVEPHTDPVSVKSFDAVNDNNAAQFSKNTGVFLTIADEATAPSLHFSLSRLAPEKKEREIIQPETTVVATMFPHEVIALDASSTGSETVRYQLDSSAGLSTIYFVLPTSRLKQGEYEAAIRLSGIDTASVVKEFAVRWREMPLSLYDLDFAVSAMRYITTDQEYDDLRSGNKAARIKKFEQFWANRDPAHATAYNEMMAEYFRRVDYAFTSFRTLKEDNGVLTDRGKIYILFGKPTGIERSLAPGGPPRELWKYASLNKEFMFEDPSRQGNYKLTATENR